ncbi:MAG: dihydroorotase family protein, partial [Candidatus Bathyarchaeota archaeon]
MTVDAILVNAKIFIHGSVFEGGLAIDEGKIVKVAKASNLPNASSRVNIEGNLILPGLIDAHVHLRDQKLAYKESFATGTAAAVAGGVTCVIDMPNNKPITKDLFSFRTRMQFAKKRIFTNVAFNSAFPEKIQEITEIVKAGAVGFKVYLSHNVGGINVNDDEALQLALNEAANCGVPVAVHAEDNRLLTERKMEVKSLDLKDFKAFQFVHSPQVEYRAIKRIVQLAKNSGVHLHFCHVSSSLGLNAVLASKSEGLQVTCEVTPHNLLLTDEQYDFFGNFALTVPPLRGLKDVKALRRALNCGYIDVVASDHAPHNLSEKQIKSIWKVSPGVPGLETMLPLLLTQVNMGHLSLSRLVKVVAEGPAKAFNLAKRGVICLGNWADLVVVDMNRESKIDSSIFHSKAKYSPFDGMHIKGQPVKTFVNGALVMEDGNIVVKPGLGKIVTNDLL